VIVHDTVKHPYEDQVIGKFNSLHSHSQSNISLLSIGQNENQTKSLPSTGHKQYKQRKSHLVMQNFNNAG